MSAARPAAMRERRIWETREVLAGAYRGIRANLEGLQVPEYDRAMVAAGAAQDLGDVSVFTTRNNRWQRNQYSVTGVTRPFAWQNAARTLAEWRGYGMDLP